MVFTASFRRSGSITPSTTRGDDVLPSAPRWRLQQDTSLFPSPCWPGLSGDTMKLDARIPSGPIEHKWDNHKKELKIVNAANKRKHTIIVVGSGLAGAAAAASLGELGYKVICFCYQDSPRRAH